MLIMAWSEYQIEDKITVATTAVAIAVVIGGLGEILAGVTPLVAGAFGLGLSLMVTPALFGLLDTMAAKMVKREMDDARVFDPKRMQAAVDRLLPHPEPAVEVAYESPRFREMVAQSQQQQEPHCRLH